MAKQQVINLSELIDQYRQLTEGVINFDFYNQMVHPHHSTAIEGSTLTLIENANASRKRNYSRREASKRPPHGR